MPQGGFRSIFNETPDSNGPLQMQSTTLLIACHGHTFEDSEEVKCIGCKSDLPLSKSGMKQGTALGQHLKKHHLIPQKIFTSGLKRTNQMARQVRKAIGVDIPIEKLEAFNEIDYGSDEGKLLKNVCERHGEATMRAWDEECIAPVTWRVDGTGYRASWFDFGDRISHEHSGETILIITHNNVARFSTILTGDTHGLHTESGVKLSPGAFGQFVHTDPYWECLGWNISPVVRTRKMKENK